MKIDRRKFLQVTGKMMALTCGTGLLAANAAEQPRKPNVLFIAIDDLNDYLTLLADYPGLKTPNLDRLAKSAVTFSHAYCAAPVCNPSRGALLSGMAPWNTGVYDNSHPINQSKPMMNGVLLPELFKKNGYTTMTSGKIFHTGPGPQRMKAMWDDQEGIQKYGPQPKVKAIPDSVKRPGMFNYEAWEGDDGDFPDVHNGRITCRRLARQYDKPFFMAYGIYRPHNPWTAPKRFFDMYPLNEVVMPKVLETDWDDLPPIARELAAYPVDLDQLRNAGYWRPVVRAYLACISFMDDSLGQVLDALDNSPHRENTILCIWADNGFHLGEKKHFAKYALWELTTHELMMWRVPGLTKGGERCNCPVNLLDVYPTLADLCGLEQPPQKLDGQSLRPFLQDPHYTWDRPAITAYLKGNYGVRDERYRYIRYRDGSEELYDHQTDPREWTNLANREDVAEIKKRLARWLPQQEMDPVGGRANRNDPDV